MALNGGGALMEGGGGSYRGGRAGGRRLGHSTVGGLGRAWLCEGAPWGAPGGWRPEEAACLEDLEGHGG